MSTAEERQSTVVGGVVTLVVEILVEKEEVRMAGVKVAEVGVVREE